MLSASIGFGVPQGGEILDRFNRTRTITRAFLDHLALVQAAAYDAPVLAVRSSRRQLPLRPCLCLGCATLRPGLQLGTATTGHPMNANGRRINTGTRAISQTIQTSLRSRTDLLVATPRLYRTQHHPRSHHPSGGRMATSVTCDPTPAELACTAIPHAAPRLSTSSPNYAPACWKPTDRSPAPEHSNTSPPHAGQPKHSTSSTQQRDNHSCH